MDCYLLPLPFHFSLPPLFFSQTKIHHTFVSYHGYTIPILIIFSTFLFIWSYRHIPLFSIFIFSFRLLSFSLLIIFSYRIDIFLETTYR
eukprot:UN02342